MNVTYSLNDIDKIIAHFRRFETIANDTEELVVKLAKVGAEAAQMAYDSTSYDGDKDVSVTSEQIGLGEAQITASGQSVAFLEWGAGILHNTPQVDRPPGVLNIGEYGKGQGKRPSWKMPNGEWTNGNEAAQGMIRAREAIEANLPNVVREVFREYY
jgi:hypothetical protein